MSYCLHCFAESGNAYKPALMLNLCGVEWTPVFVDFFNGENRSADFLELNELGEVPILQTGDLVLTQSGVILDYLASELNQFGGSSDSDRREILRWLFFDNHKYTSYLATLRFTRHFAKDVDPAIDAFLEQRVRKAFSVADKRLASVPWIAGESVTIADISMAGYMFYLDEAKLDLAPYPHLASWRERIQQLDGWVGPYELMPSGPEKTS